jgi:hypothetical protein
MAAINLTVILLANCLLIIASDAIDVNTSIEHTSPMGWKVRFNLLGRLIKFIIINEIYLLLDTFIYNNYYLLTISKFNCISCNKSKPNFYLLYYFV